MLISHHHQKVPKGFRPCRVFHMTRARDTYFFPFREIWFPFSVIRGPPSSMHDVLFVSLENSQSTGMWRASTRLPPWLPGTTRRQRRRERRGPAPPCAGVLGVCGGGVGGGGMVASGAGSAAGNRIQPQLSRT
jgi:hypothetical protein